MIYFSKHFKKNMISAISNSQIFPNQPIENNHNKIKTIFISTINYIKEAFLLFFKDIYQNIFSYKIITKIPFFILSYSLYASFGLIDAIYYVSLSILIFKMSKDLLNNLEERKKIFTFKEAFPIDNKSEVYNNLLFGFQMSPFLFFLDFKSMEFSKNILKYFNFNVFDDSKLIQQAGFIGKFAVFYSILILPPVKEMLFRGYIQNYFSTDPSSKKDLFLTVLKTSLIFALFHFSPTSGLINIPIMLSQFMTGMFLSYVKTTTNNYWLNIFLSFFYSFISVIYYKNSKVIT
ncbi:MAG: hypothetical protein A2888_03520 [Chlamydiae bacterium RIFCSPLOWO2_01_FULL_28_7]|nr:MAG: hypothetical protein A2888_03520 [Chlamydiae bacterium RIFCSPLOWO2_01_FULL_28_7]